MADRKKKDTAKRVEMRDRVAYAANLLARYAKKHEAFKLLMHRYGISARTCERILARARDDLARRHGQTKDGHHQDAYSFYSSILRDPASTLEQRMSAQQEICRLFGLYAPQRLAHGGDAEGEPLRMEVRETIVTTREEVAAVIEACKAAGTKLIGVES